MKFPHRIGLGSRGLSRRVQRGFAVVAPVLCLVVLLVIMTSGGRRQSFAIDTGNYPSELGLAPQHDGSSPIPSPCRWDITMLRESPMFSERHVLDDAIREYLGDTRGGQPVSPAAAGVAGGTSVGAGANSVKVDAEDIQRARENVVRMLPSVTAAEHFARWAAPAESAHGAPLSNVCSLRLGADLFNALRNFLQEVALDARPIVEDFGCVLGPWFASVHRNASVVCMDDGSRKQTTRFRSLSSPQRASWRPPLAAIPVAKRPANLLWLSAPDGFLAEPFTQLYSACNFATVGIMLWPILTVMALDASAAAVEDTTETLMRLLDATLPSTAVTVAAIPQSARFGDESTGEICTYVLSRLSLHATKSNVTCAVLLTLTVPRSSGVRSSTSTTFHVLRFVLHTSTRPCRKTWGAPLVQWDRAQRVEFLKGRVTFRVESVKANGGGASSPLSTTATTTTMRTIHPLQYIHSLNVDTLLGAGLSMPQRLRFLGNMIRAPRYSDPLPHNWVLAGGGQLQRIDKIDLRYDRDVDESKGYWGHSTRGYLHLLAYHLCLPLAPNGLPEAAEGNDEARRECRACARTCSYLPKGTTPCEHCLRCGGAIVEIGSRLSSDTGEPDTRDPGSRHCQKTYSSMHSARSVWKQWEKADRKHSIE